MPESPLPPSYIVYHASILYDLTIPPEIRDTWAQLYGLAWNSENREAPETPAMKFEEFLFWTGKKRSTLWGHMAFLRDRSKLLYETTKDRNIIVRFPGFPLTRQSKILDTVNTSSPPIILDSNKREEEIISVQNFGLDREQVRRVSGKKNSTPTVPADTLRAIVDTLSFVTGMDKVLNYGRLAKEAKTLHLAGYSSEQVRAVFQPGGKWYAYDWRGKKGQKPALGQVRETIKGLMEQKNGAEPVKPETPLDRRIRERKEREQNGDI